MSTDDKTTAEQTAKQLADKKQEIKFMRTVFFIYASVSVLYGTTAYKLGKEEGRKEAYVHELDALQDAVAYVTYVNNDTLPDIVISCGDTTLGTAILWGQHFDALHPHGIYQGSRAILSDHHIHRNVGRDDTITQGRNRYELEKRKILKDSLK